MLFRSGVFVAFGTAAAFIVAAAVAFILLYELDPAPEAVPADD